MYIWREKTKDKEQNKGTDKSSEGKIGMETGNGKKKAAITWRKRGLRSRKEKERTNKRQSQLDRGLLPEKMGQTVGQE